MNKTIRQIALSVLLLLSWTAHAEDIDLFVSAPIANSDLPNVLIILDNTANWSTPFTNEMSALSTIMSTLPADKFKVGIMLFTETGSPNNNVDGGYVRAAVRQLSASNKLKYQALVNSFDKNNDKSNGGKASLIMWEAYQYFKGLAPNGGNNKVKTDYAGNTSGTAASNAIYALSGNALNSISATTYNSPITSGCAKNFIIYISNGSPADNNNDITASTSALSAAGGDTTTIPLSPSGSQGIVADEWARFMHKTDIAVVTYSVDIDPVTTGQGPGWTALLQSMADVSKGKYFSVSSGNANNVVVALNTIFTEIQSVNSVFASVSLPVTASTQGQYLNQVFIGMFRPDVSSQPRWYGNLKQYQLGYINGALNLVDANGNAAVNSSTGFITGCARSFWTPSTTDTYWSFSPYSECLSVTGADASNYPDGNVVEKGAQAYVLRNNPSTGAVRSSSSGRTVYTCDSTTSCTILRNYTTSNTTLTGVMATNASSASPAISAVSPDTTAAQTLINWSRGEDRLDENNNYTGSGSTSPYLTEMRASSHGDVVHSQPVAVNYGTVSSPNVVVFYGGNDGYLRAINGNQTSSYNGYNPGEEIWSFMPPEFYPAISRLYNNLPRINFPGILTSASEPTPTPKNYGFDGPLSTYLSSNGNTVWLFGGLRRGGRALYGFDVSTPANPSLKWHIGCPNAGNDTGCGTGLTGLGQTWSSPKVVFSNASSYGSNKPLLITGGGYDTCQDNDPDTCTSSSKGGHIFVFDASNGNLLSDLNTGMGQGIVADVSVITDSNGYIKFAYAVDLGGNVYRISGSSAYASMNGAAPSSWTLTQIASLGCSTAGTTCTPHRKLMFAPDVVDLGNGEYQISFGSGDREKPISYYPNAYSTTDYFFSIVDFPTNTTWLTSTPCSGSVICLGALTNIPSVTSNTSSISSYGWYLSLSNHESVVTSSVTVFGIISFSTHIPAVASAGNCANLGTTNVYNISTTNAVGSKTISAAEGLPPSPVAGVVLVNGVATPVSFGTSSDGGIAPVFNVPPSSTNRAKSKVYWNINE